MAKFARLCMHRMTELTREMEVSLGPDTGDLQLRVGLHSGPVTAGVLKGEQARFQLFGDTVNTASRMESNGIKNRIHCSEATANLLKMSGKEHWVKMRDEMIHVKGKGKVATYWVKPRSSPGSANAGDGDDLAIEVVLDDRGDDSSSISSFDNSCKSTSSINDTLLLDINTWESSSRLKRLVDYNVNLLSSYLKQIEAHRIDWADEKKVMEKVPVLDQKDGATALDEVTECVSLPKLEELNRRQRRSRRDKKTRPKDIQLDPLVLMELKDYVTTIASMYRDNPFHGFDHASHVTQSTSKLLKRIVLTDEMDHLESQHHITALDLHDYTFGIATDPLTQFALIFCALIHDVDHPGVTNGVLIKENTPLAKFYKNKRYEQNADETHIGLSCCRRSLTQWLISLHPCSPFGNSSIAEQNSVDLAWILLMDDNYSHLQRAIYRTEGELKRFRQLVVNIVLATDIFDKDMKAMRELRWEKAFVDEKQADLVKASSSDGLDDSTELSLSTSVPSKNAGKSISSNASLQHKSDLKATIVMEHLIQSSDVAHTMQHFDIYLKWNERLFREMYSAYEAGRGPGGSKDPSKSWYEGEIMFFDRYIIPLARKLDSCGVFGVSSDEYLNFAMQNRKEWANRGDILIKDFVKRYHDDKAKQKGGSSDKVGSGVGISKDAAGGEKTKITRSSSLDFGIIPEDG